MNQLFCKLCLPNGVVVVVGSGVVVVGGSGVVVVVGSGVVAAVVVGSGVVVVVASSEVVATAGAMADRIADKPEVDVVVIGASVKRFTLYNVLHVQYMIIIQFITCTLVKPIIFFFRKALIGSHNVMY